jgi:hypothetical protein
MRDDADHARYWGAAHALRRARRTRARWQAKASEPSTSKAVRTPQWDATIPVTRLPTGAPPRSASVYMLDTLPRIRPSMELCKMEFAAVLLATISASSTPKRRSTAIATTIVLKPRAATFERICRRRLVLSGSTAAAPMRPPKPKTESAPPNSRRRGERHHGSAPA